MREILFKAKRIDNGEWVECYYAFIDNVHYIYTGSLLNFGLYVVAERFEIDIDTLCQYTCLNDKNGQKIWENDVVEIPQENGKFIIEWNETEAKWQMNNYAEEFIVDFDNYWSYNTEVIGNIFDNTELINE